MIVFIHISCAVASIITATLLLLRPSQRALRASYVLVTGTIVSGSYLVLAQPTRLLSTCVSGLFYLAFTMSGIAVARHRVRV